MADSEKTQTDPVLDDVTAASAAIASLAARAANDREFASQLIKAQHAGDVDGFERLVRSAGVPATAELVSEDVTDELFIAIGVQVTVSAGAVTVSVVIKVKKKR